jgi:hypothetical protein
MRRYGHGNKCPVCRERPMWYLSEKTREELK